MRFFQFIAVIWLALVCAIATSHAEKRVALVVGNSAYLHADKLTNPVNDARGMRDALTGIKFDVIYGEDLDSKALRRMIGRFGSRVDGAEVALVYFAGHGATFGDVPYVVPVDAEFAHIDEMPAELVTVEELIGDLRRAKSVRIAILDACRDNRAEQKLKQSRGGPELRGLAPPKNPAGLIIAYATQHGATAADSAGSRNSPFTAALLHNVATPGLDVKEMFFKVGSEVEAATSGRQRPEISISMYEQYALAPGAAPKPVRPVVVTPPAGPAADEVTWSILKDTKDPGQLRRFIAQFPASPRRREAEEQLNALGHTVDTDRESTLLAKTAAQATGGNAGNEHQVTIKKGDTLGAILRNQGATLEEIKAIYGQFGDLARDGNFKEGQKLRIMLGASPGTQRLLRVMLVSDQDMVEAVVALSDISNRYVNVNLRDENSAPADHWSAKSNRLRGEQIASVAPPVQPVGAPPAAEGPPAVATGARLSGDDRQTRLTIDLSRPIEMRAFAIAEPYRVVIELPQVDFQFPPDVGDQAKGIIKAFRYGLVKAGESRIVIDLTGPVRVTKAAMLGAANGKPAQMVLDMVAVDRETFLREAAMANAGAPAQPSSEITVTVHDVPPEYNDKVVFRLVLSAVRLRSGASLLDITGIKSAPPNAGATRQRVVVLTVKDTAAVDTIGAELGICAQGNCDVHLSLHPRYVDSRAGGDPHLFAAMRPNGADSLPVFYKRLNIYTNVEIPRLPSRLPEVSVVYLPDDSYFQITFKAGRTWTEALAEIPRWDGTRNLLKLSVPASPGGWLGPSLSATDDPGLPPPGGSATNAPNVLRNDP